MKKVLIISFLVFTILIGFLCTNVSAIVVTEEALQSAFQKIAEESNNTSDDSNSISTTNMTIDKDNKKIKFFNNTKLIGTIDYDLSTLTFSTEVTIDNSTTYEEWKEKESELSTPILMYVLIADLNGISYEDSMTYILMKSLSSSFSSNTNSNTGYTITETDEGGFITDKDGNNIPLSEFPKYAVEITKDLYSSPVIYTDSKDNNTFKYTTELLYSVTDTENSEEVSCGLKSILTIRTDADFSKLNGYADNTIGQLGNTMQNMVNGIQQATNSAQQALNNIIIQQESVNKVTSSMNKLPQTGDSFGLKDGLYILCITSSIALIYIIFKAVKYRNIEK